jgi:hypothetical protein
VAVRAAIGAGRARLVRQFLTESLVLALLGSLLGLIVAYAGVRGFLAWTPIEIPRADEISVNLSVLAFAAGIGIFTAACFGLAPALLQSRVDLQETLREAARGTAGGARWARNLLVVGQVALAVMLLSGAGLLVRSVGELLNEDTGVTVRTALTTDIQLSDVDYDALARGRATFYRPCCWRALAWHSPGPAQASRQPRSEHVCWVGCSTASGRQIPFPSVRHSPWYSPSRSRPAFCPAFARPGRNRCEPSAPTAEAPRQSCRWPCAGSFRCAS